ncbi:MAG: efflux RND transporter periplasmic adaptor subunit [bacterium]|nr:efflux RND transporter periplasmic adaptor subunit [bacterium]
MSAKIKKIIKGRPYAIALVAIVVLTGLYLYFGNNTKPVTNTISATSGSVIQEVSVTGKVKSSLTADLSFEKSGKISNTYVKVGDKVMTGEPLVALENRDVSAALSQANAELQVDQAKLDEILKGTRKEDIQVKQSELDKSKHDLENYYDNVKNVSENAYIKADDAVRIKTAGIFSGFKSSVYQFTYTTCAYNAESDARNLRLKSETVLDNWKNEIDSITSATSRFDLENILVHTTTNLDVVRTLLQKINETLVTGCTISDTSLNTYRTNISLARTNIITASENVTGLSQSIGSQKLTIQKIQNELDLKLAGSTAEEVKAQEAQVMFSKARVQSAQAEVSKTIIYAPFSGVISKQDAKIGESASMNQKLVSILSDYEFEIEAFLPEADFTKVNIGDIAKVTLDAYGSDVVFEAKVAFIDPGETVLEGVPTYKTIFRFTKIDNRIRSGMTANVDIETARKENVITIPQRSIITRDGIKYVKILNNSLVEEIQVTTGLKGSKGDIEVLSGILVGDQIVQP